MSPLSSAQYGICQSDSCPAFGTKFDAGHDTSNKGLWLNFDTPAQCSGTATEWRFCYYFTYDGSLEARLRVYRKNGDDSYQRAFEDPIQRDYENSGDLRPGCNSGSQYCCETLTINQPIQKNDIIGVCMSDGSNRKPLYVLDEEVPGHSVYQYPSTDDCSNAGVVMSFTTSDLDQSPNNGFGLNAFLSVTGK